MLKTEVWKVLGGSLCSKGSTETMKTFACEEVEREAKGDGEEHRNSPGAVTAQEGCG